MDGRRRWKPFLIPTAIVACDSVAGVAAGLDGNSGLLKFWGVGMIVIVGAYNYEFRNGSRRTR